MISMPPSQLAQRPLEMGRLIINSTYSQLNELKGVKEGKESTGRWECLRTCKTLSQLFFVFFFTTRKKDKVKE
jgi:hypothetical protein